MLDLTLRPDPDGHDRPGVWWLLAGPHWLTIEVEPGLGRHGTTCLLTGPAGDGEAWIDGVPTPLGLQVGGTRARVGGRDVLLRRNGPKLRRANRELTVQSEDGDLDWVMRFDQRPARIVEVATGRDLWRREDGGGAVVAPDLPADQLAALALFDHLQVDVVCHVNIVRYI